MNPSMTNQETQVNKDIANKLNIDKLDEKNEPFNLDDTLEALHLFDINLEIEANNELYPNTENQLDSFLLIQEDTSSEAKLPMPDLFVDIFSDSFLDQLLDDENELYEVNDEDINAIGDDFSNAWNGLSVLDSWSKVDDVETPILEKMEVGFDFSNSEVDTAIEASPIYHKNVYHKDKESNKEPIDEDTNDEDTNLHLNLEIPSQVLTNDTAIHIPLYDLEILEDLSEELLMRKGGLDVYIGGMKILSEEAQKNLQSLALNAVTQDQTAIALLQNTLESLANALNLAEQQTYAMSQDVRHLRGNLHQVLNTRSVTRVLLIDIEQMCLAISSKVILEVIPIELYEDFENREAILWRDRLIPVVRLDSLLKLNCRHNLNQVSHQSNQSLRLHGHLERYKPANAKPSFLVMCHENDVFALQTDGCWSDQEATFHHIEGDITLPNIFLGAVILGNSQAIALLNPSELVSQCVRSRSDKTGLVTQTSSTLPNIQTIQTNLHDLSSLSDFFGADDSQQNSSRPQSPQPKILIVESSANVRRYLAMTLAKSGFLTEQVQNGREAIALLQKRLDTTLDIDIVITDLEMPQMDGFKLLSDIRNDKLLQNLPVVVLTSRNNENNQKLALELGATAYFSKPYQELELVTSLKQILAIAVN